MAKKPTKSKGIIGRDAEGKAVRVARVRSRFFDWRTLGAERLKGRRQELLTYKNHLKELLKHKGKYVVIKGDSIIGIYSDREQALDEVDDRFGDDGALVKQIVAREPIHSLGGAAF
ncbi:MAG: hypothetical protein P4L84_32980 [Isosphaeraceae bacterium]|nr:hypothetical protein [Isosphaeraceae bacterium]